MMLVFGFWTVFTIPAVVIALVGGALTGLALGSIWPPNPLVRGSRVFAAFSVIGFLGLIFFAGQTVEVALGSEPQHWTRLVARAILWLFFAFALAVAGTWAQQRRWKQ